MVARQVDGALQKAKAANGTKVLRTAQVPCRGLLKDVDMLSMFAVWSTTFAHEKAYEKAHEKAHCL
jgi:hypothetical protein